MKRSFLLLLTSLVFALVSSPGLCAEGKPNPWEKVSVGAGIFFSSVDSSFRLGGGIGISIDPEELLDLSASGTVARADATWRFTDNRRHRADLTWFAFRRSGQRTIAEDITIEDPTTGEPIDIDAGTRIKGHFDLDIYQLAYSYSFLQDDRIDLAAQLGLYVMPIDFGFSVSGLAEGSASANFTAPLPTFGLRMDFLVAPKWYIRTASQLFYLEYKQFKGSLVAFRGAVEYNPWEHVGFGLGVDSFRVRAEAKGEDYPAIDFRGNLEFSYVGLQLYARVFF